MLGLSILLIVGAALAWLWIEQRRRDIAQRMDEIDRDNETWTEES